MKVTLPRWLRVPRPRPSLRRGKRAHQAADNNLVHSPAAVATPRRNRAPEPAAVPELAGVLGAFRSAALWAIAVLTATADGAAFTESYRGLFEWAEHHNFTGFWAAAFPAQVDTFIMIGELALFVAMVGRWERRDRLAAWAVALLGLAVSVAGNVGHIAARDLQSRGTAAVAPLAAFAALWLGLSVLKRVLKYPQAAGLAAGDGTAPGGALEGVPAGHLAEVLGGLADAVRALAERPAVRRRCGVRRDRAPRRAARGGPRRRRADQRHGFVARPERRRARGADRLPGHPRGREPVQHERAPGQVRPHPRAGREGTRGDRRRARPGTRRPERPPAHGGRHAELSNRKPPAGASLLADRRPGRASHRSEALIVSENPFGGEDEAEDVEPEAADAEVIPLPGVTLAPVKPKRGEPGEWKPVVPEHLRTPEGRRKAADWHWKRAKHHGAYHGVRSPWRLVLTLVYAVVGLTRIAAVQIAWWWNAEQTFLRHKAIADGDTGKYLQLHKHAREVRLVRGFVLLAEVIGLAVGAGELSSVSLLLWIPVGLVAVPVLAWIGRPEDKPIMSSSVVPAVIDRLTVALIVRALGALGIGEMNKALRLEPAKAIVTVDGPMRDGPGWLWRGELPPGVTAAQVSEKREELASGLRRPLGCVWPETDHKRHPGALNLYVSDEDMTTAEQPPWPLAKRGAVNMFNPSLFGYDPRGRPVTVLLMFASIIIGAVPRMGKTFLLRLLLLIAALDVRAEIHAYDLKGTGDLAPARPVAHAYGVGDEPEDMARMIADFRGLRRELRRRTKVIRDIAETDPARCPENKITDELASDPRLGLHPIVIAVDECQIAFEHPVYGEEFEAICTDLAKRGPALGIIIILATQRPDAKSIPPGIRANVVLKMCLYVTGQVENDMVLGTSQYKSGIRATMFGFDAKGVLYFGGEGLRPRIMRAQYIDGPLSRLIFARARLMRERAGRVTGYAAGEDFQQDTRSFARDVLEVFGDDEKLWGETIAERLAGSFGEAYEGITRDAVLSQLRALEIEVKAVREPGQKPKQGCEREAVRDRADRAGL